MDVRKEALRRGLRNKTVVAYSYCVKEFLKLTNKMPRQISKKDVKEFLYRLKERGASNSTLNVYLSAIKFLMRDVLNKRFVMNVKYSKVRKRYPTYLTQDEIERLLSVIINEKHKLIVSLMYGAGLRVSEVVKLRVVDLEFLNNYGWVRDGKGGKDRMFIIAKNLKEELMRLVEGKDYGGYVFEGQNGHLSARSVNEIIKKAAKRARLKKNVHAHTLRHSFATHLVENGYSASDVQPLLGHNDINTTMTYVHMAAPRMLAVESPLDSLDERI